MPGRHRDHHRGRREIELCVHVHADGEHVVRPDDEADHADRDERVDHAQIAEDRLAAERGHHLAHDPEARQDHDVDLGMAEEPEKVLVEDRVAAARRVEEVRAEIAVGQQHGDRAREHRQRQQQQEGGDQDGPDEERHLVQAHAGRAHVEDRRDHVDRAEDRARAGEVKREDHHVDRGARDGRRRERGIERPAGAGAIAGAARHEGRADEQDEGRRQQPEARYCSSAGRPCRARRS